MTGKWKLMGNNRAANSTQETLVSSRHAEHSTVQVKGRLSDAL
jgi:hypothetical protein